MILEEQEKKPILLDENGNKVKKFFAIYDNPMNPDKIYFHFVAENGENQYREFLEAQLAFLSFMRAHPNLNPLGKTLEDAWNKFFSEK